MESLSNPFVSETDIKGGNWVAIPEGRLRLYNIKVGGRWDVGPIAFLQLQIKL